MKCAKCGNEISPDAPNCPYCAGGETANGAHAEFSGSTGEFRGRDGGRAPALSCPRCGSQRIQTGVVTNGRAGAVCLECGTPVQTGRNPVVVRGCGGCLLFVVILLLLLIVFGGC
jgi:DNA-directed RNA polymerase subunit RPC12/RpoP